LALTESAVGQLEQQQFHIHRQSPQERQLQSSYLIGGTDVLFACDW
jgi:hypothetical protein